MWGLLEGPSKRLFPSEFNPIELKHTSRGTVSMATAPLRAGGDENERVSGSQFIITLGDNLDYLDSKQSIFGQVVEGFDTLETINNAFCDEMKRPLKDIRLRHAIVLDDPFDNPPGRSISPPDYIVSTRLHVQLLKSWLSLRNVRTEGRSCVSTSRGQKAEQRCLCVYILVQVPHRHGRPSGFIDRGNCQATAGKLCWPLGMHDTENTSLSEADPDKYPTSMYWRGPSMYSRYLFPSALCALLYMISDPCSRDITSIIFVHLIPGCAFIGSVAAGVLIS